MLSQVGRRIMSTLPKMNVSPGFIQRGVAAPMSAGPTQVHQARPLGIVATPSHALTDDDTLTVSVVGLNRHEPVTLHSSLNENGMTFAAVGHYKADDTGSIDSTRDPSHGGSFSGVEPMGLLWGMEQAPGQRSGLRLMKKDVTQPFVISLDVHRGHLGLEELYQGKPSPLLSGSIQRSYMGRGVQRIPVQHSRIRGTLFLPEGKGPFPGVIDMFGAVGGLVEFRSALLASRGFATFALPYFNYQDLPKSCSELDLEYFEEATAFLLSQPSVLKYKGVGVVGVSKGCEVAYAMAEFIPEVKAVVGINGLCCTCDTNFKHGGKVVKVGVAADKNKITSDDKGIISLAEALPAEVDESAIFHIEKSDASFLFVRGLDDQCVPPSASVVAPDRLRKFGKTNFEDLRYPAAGHLIEPPFTPHVVYTYHRFSSGHGTLMYWGGETLAHARAQEDSWPKILHFLKKQLTCGECRERSSL